MSRQTSSRTLKTTDTTLSIIEYIVENGGARVTELAEAFDLSKATIHSHLATLRSRGYLVKDNNTYRIGLKFLHIGGAAKNEEPRYELIRETIVNLSTRSYEEADFNVEEHGRIISLYNEIGDTPEFEFRYYYMHTTAVGKAMLAEYDDERVKNILDRWGLPSVTEHTITDRDELLTQFEQIREHGYAWSNQEFSVGLKVVGVVIHEPDGSIFGGVSLGAPFYRIQEAGLEQDMIDQVLFAKDKLEKKLVQYEA
jgi:DNA-binding IclR family transcriptional regulator